MNIEMPTPLMIEGIPRLSYIRIDIVPPNETDKFWAAEITGAQNNGGLKFHATYKDESYHWVEMKVRDFIKRLNS